MNYQSPLRSLALQLHTVAKEHFCYSQVVELMVVVDAHINALALIEETNHAEIERSNRNRAP
jgi:hypothetical protein